MKSFRSWVPRACNNCFLLVVRYVYTWGRSDFFALMEELTVGNFTVGRSDRKPDHFSNLTEICLRHFVAACLIETDCLYQIQHSMYRPRGVDSWLSPGGFLKRILWIISSPPRLVRNEDASGLTTSTETTWSSSRNSLRTQPADFRQLFPGSCTTHRLAKSYQVTDPLWHYNSHYCKRCPPRTTSVTSTLSFRPTVPPWCRPLILRPHLSGSAISSEILRMLTTSLTTVNLHVQSCSLSCLYPVSHPSFIWTLLRHRTYRRDHPVRVKSTLAVFSVTINFLSEEKAQAGHYSILV